MSSATPPNLERVPLLRADDGNAPMNSTSSEDHVRFKLSPARLIIPVAVLCRLAILLPSTTNFDILQNASCRLWYLLYDSSAIPPAGSIPDALCAEPAIEQYYTAITSMIAVLDGVGTALGCGIANFFASRVGRKPALFGLCILSMSGRSFMLISQFAPGWFQFLFLALWISCDMFANPVVLAFCINTYIVDVVRAEDRTAELSKIAGWSTLGGAISFAVGGTLTTKSGSSVLVYLSAISILAVTSFYTLFVLPESLTEAKREELKQQRCQSPSRSNWKVVLAVLKPTYDVSRKRCNARLLFCALHIFIVTFADAYAVLSLILYFTTQYRYTPAQTGYVLTTLNLTGVVVLTTAVPLVVRYLRPLYARIQLHETMQAPISDEARRESVDAVRSEDVVSETSDHLDVHITFTSWIIEATAYIAAGLASTMVGQLAAVFCIGLGAGRAPVFRSLVVSSVSNIKQGEALAAIEIVSSGGMILSPIVMGSILTATISKAPQTIFYVHAGFIVAGASVLFFIRDSDRYQKATPHED